MEVIPTNTELGEYIIISRIPNIFFSQKVYGKAKNEGHDKGKFCNPQVWFSYAISCMVDPTILVKKISYKEARMKRIKMSVNELQTHCTASPIAFYHLSNEDDTTTLIQKFMKIINMGRLIEETESMKGEQLDTLPLMMMRTLILELMGLNTSNLNNIPFNIQYANCS